MKAETLGFFWQKIKRFNNKISNDIDSIEKMKYEYFDLVIKRYKEIEEEHKKHQAEEKEKHDKEKEKQKKIRRSQTLKNTKKENRPKPQGLKRLWHLQKIQD